MRLVHDDMIMRIMNDYCGWSLCKGEKLNLVHVRNNSHERGHHNHVMRVTPEEQNPVRSTATHRHIDGV